jgi:endophilin-A
MSLSGFMKQINKANQMISEKIGGAKGTDLDGEFQIMEKKTDIIYKLIDDVNLKTNEFLQPNPASRAKLYAVNNFSKIRGQVKNTPYPQPEGTLGETFIKYGRDLGEETNFGNAMIDMGESLRQMAGIKYALEDNIKQNFLDPFSSIKDNDLKDVMHLRKKTENRRLDYDCKKRKKSAGSAIPEEELAQANEKFEESRIQTENAMQSLLNNEAEHITHLMGFAEGYLEYHHQCYEILQDMVKKLNEKKRRISSTSKVYEPSFKKMNITNNGIGGIGAERGIGFDASGGVNANSEGSSSASRFYDNGADTTSSLSDNAYSENHSIANKVAPALNGKIPINGFDMTSSVQHKTNIMSGGQKSSSSSQAVPPPINQRSMNSSKNSKEPAMCKALYDFDAENVEELDFKEGNVIKLIARLDENWLQGELNGRQGRFPVSYVETIVPLQ